MFKYYIAQRCAGCVVVRESKEGEKKTPTGPEMNLMKAVEPIAIQMDLQWMEEQLVQFFQENWPSCLNLQVELPVRPVVANDVGINM